MEIKFKLPAIVLGLMFLFSGQPVKAQDDYVSLQQFYDELSPYGTWINDPQYGYVWRPDVDQSEFRPYYTNGRWVQTEYGNTWVSNYEWGWAPFHYGRWMVDRYNRWLWIPDTVWGPAWVDWRSGGGYYGWAPIGPSVSIHINIGNRYYRPDFAWNFIPMRNIYYGSYPRYRSYNNVRIINRTKIINNTYVYNSRTYNTGPRPEEVRRATNQNVRVYDIARNNRAGATRIDQNTVNIYTPRPSRESVNNPMPRNVGVNNNSRGSNTNDRTVAPGRTDVNRGNAPVAQPSRTGTTRENDRTVAPTRTDVNRGSAPAAQAPRTGTTRENEARPGRVQSNPGSQPTTAPRNQSKEMSTTPSQPRQQQQPPARQQAQPRQERPQVQQRTQQKPPTRTQESRGNSNSGGGRSESGRPGRGN